MLKKVVISWVVFASVVLLGINVIGFAERQLTTDEYIMTRYCEEYNDLNETKLHGEFINENDPLYGNLVQDDVDDERVEFKMCDSDGRVIFAASCDRDIHLRSYAMFE